MNGLFLLAALSAGQTYIDTITVNLPDHTVGLYGCQTAMQDGTLYGWCAGSDRLPPTPQVPSSRIIYFGAVTQNFVHWPEDGQCLLLSETQGTYGEAQYVLSCGDIIFADSL